jgi:hypothetical protein
MRRNTATSTGAAVSGLLIPNCHPTYHAGNLSDTDAAGQVTGLALCVGYVLRAIRWATALVQRDRELLGRTISIGTGAAVAGFLTYGIVRAAQNLGDILPVSTYYGFFQHIAFAVERLWSNAHGWQSWSNLEQFGRFYARMVRLLCPSIGFALFWIISRHRVGINVWKPMAIATILALTPLLTVTDAPFLALGWGRAWSEVVRTVLIVWLMAWSVGGIAGAKPHAAATEQ